MAKIDLSRWFPDALRSRKPTRPLSRRAQPMLQMLEAREVPATHIWTDASPNSNNWSDAANWTGGKPTSDEPGGTIVQIPLNDSSMFQDIAGLEIDQLEFKNSGSATLTLNQPLAVNGTLPINVINTSGTNTITGAGDFQLTGNFNPFFAMTAGSLKMDVVISSPTNNRDLVLNSGSGVLELTKDNTYTGDTHVNQGILRLNGPIGGTTTLPANHTLFVGNADTNVAEAFVQLGTSSQLANTTAITVATDGVFTLINGASNVIGDVTLAGGQLTTGAGNLAIQNVHATADATISGSAGGQITLLNGQHTIDVDAGKTLTITAPIVNAGAGAVGGIIKIGTGTLGYANPSLATPNTYSGPTAVNNGILSLNDGAPNSAFLGTLTIGDGLGLTGSAIVRLGAINEIPNATVVNLMQDGRLDLNGHNETIGGLQFDGGGEVVTGASVLTLTGNVTSFGTGSAGGTITGTIDLGGQDRTFNISQTPAAIELLVDGVIQGTGGLVKAGAGTMQVTGPLHNTYSGVTTVSAGVFEMNKVPGANAVPHNLIIGANGMPPGTAIARNVLSHQIESASDVWVASGGRLDLNGRTDQISTLTLGNASAGGEVITGAGRLITGNIASLAAPSSSTITGNLDLGGITPIISVQNGTAPTDLRIDAVISNGAFVKDGPGALVLTGANIYTGQTTVKAGTLSVNGSQAGSPAFTTGGTLAGSGTIGNVNGGVGIIAPGGSPGTLTTNAFTIGGNTYQAELNGPAAGQFDQIKVNGTVNLTGGTLVPSLGFNSTSGQSFVILDNDGNDAITGTFMNLPEGAQFLLNGSVFAISYVGGTGNDVTLTNVTPVPVVPPVSPPDAQPVAVSPPVVVPAVAAFGVQQFAVGADAGGATVRVFNPDQSERFSSNPFPGSPGGIRTATADFNGDGIADVVVGTGPGGPTHLKVLDGKTGAVLFAMDPFEASFTGGVYVAAGDVTGDGVADFVVSPDEGGGPRVRVFNGKTFTQIADFFGIDDPNFRGGARIAIGDMNKDGVGDLIVAAGFGGGPRVAGFDGTTLGSGPKKVFGDFLAFETGLRNGIFVAAGDVTGDGVADLVAGGGPGGGPRVTVLDGASLRSNNLNPVANFLAGDADNRGGVRVAVKDIDGDAKLDVLTGSGAGAGSRVTGYAGKAINGSPTPAFAFDALPGFNGGVFVG